MAAPVQVTPMATLERLAAALETTAWLGRAKVAL